MGNYRLSRRTFLKWSTTLGATLGVTSGLEKLTIPTSALAGVTETKEQVATGTLPYGADRIVKCRCGCGDVCGVHHIADVYVKDQQIVWYGGAKEGWNKGGLCPRGASGLQIIYSPDRLKYPMKRVGERGSGKWERISWEEALDIISDKIVAAIKGPGPHTVAVCQGHNMTSTTGAVRARLAAIYGFDSFEGPHPCWNNLRFGAWATLGDYNHLKEEDFHYSKLIVIWGHNPAIAMPTEWRDGMYRAKQEFGAKIVVIDPRFTETAEKADMYIPIRPGTDAALALGLANVIINEGLYDREFVEKYTVGFEEYKELAQKYPPEEVEKITWAPADKIRELARMYATIKPAVLEVGRGVNYTADNSGWLGPRGITCLIGLTGQVGVRGAGYSVEASLTTPSNSGFIDFPFASLTKGAPTLVPRTKGVKYAAGSAARAIERLYYRKPYGYEVLLVFGTNILAKSPATNVLKEAMMQIPFIVVEDRFINTTGNIADILLPTSTWVEQAILYAEYSHLVCTPPAIKPMFESKPSFLIYAELSDKLCQKLRISQPPETYFPWRKDEDLINALLASKDLPMGGYPALNYQYVIKHPEGIRGARPYNQEGYVWFRQDGDPNKPLVFPTPSGKIELKAQQLEDKWGLPALPVHEEPFESPFSTPDVFKEYPLIGHSRVHRHWGFLQYNLISDGGYASPFIREAFPTAKEPTLELNPAKARELGLKEGDLAWVESRYGKIKARVIFSERIPPELVVTPYHWGNIQNVITPPRWSLFEGAGYNTVGPYGTPSRFIDVSGQSMYAGFLCKVYKA
ncbi:Nitrate reductase [Neomoorella glycerini]|uniref:Nitrate reductase n=1 Tax=Neomoorella glycerini TaxID=55779 RepID=A0A6I5ZML0_9FIRM|nr:molybdopterin-dependent oxidoreductase [Moorella glycerini]QGP90861.1 Nitrate reductase [Moorella glycerini]